MTRPHRRMHVVVWTVLPVLAAALVAAAVVTRVRLTEAVRRDDVPVKRPSIVQPSAPAGGTP